MRLRLREWRERRLLTQRELAEQVGMSTGQINRIENGIHEPRFTTIRKLAVALNVSPEELVVWEVQGQPEDEVSKGELRS